MSQSSEVAEEQKASCLVGSGVCYTVVPFWIALLSTMWILSVLSVIQSIIKRTKLSGDSEGSINQPSPYKKQK